MATIVVCGFMAIGAMVVMATKATIASMETVAVMASGAFTVIIAVAA